MNRRNGLPIPGRFGGESDSDEDRGDVEPEPPAYERRDPTELIAAAVARYGASLTTRAVLSYRKQLGRRPGRASRSTKDGFRPSGADHLRRFLMYEVLDLSSATLAASEGISESAVRNSVRIGRSMIRQAAKLAGDDYRDFAGGLRQGRSASTPQ